MSRVSAVVLRDGVNMEEPLRVALGFLEAYGFLDASSASPAESFDEADLRLANRGGARISAAEMAETLGRRRAIEGALRKIAPAVSLAAEETTVPWAALLELFDAFAGIRGVGLSKMTKALHPKRPGVIPMLDSVVQIYLQDDDPGPKAPFGERALELVRAYKRDLDRNEAALKAVREKLAVLGHDLTEVRILDVLIWSSGAS